MSPEFGIPKADKLISGLGKSRDGATSSLRSASTRAKLRIIPPEHEAKIAHYQKWWDDLFGKGK